MGLQEGLLSIDIEDKLCAKMSFTNFVHGARDSQGAGSDFIMTKEHTFDVLGKTKNSSTQSEEKQKHPRDFRRSHEQHSRYKTSPTQQENANEKTHKRSSFDRGTRGQDAPRKEFYSRENEGQREGQREGKNRKFSDRNESRPKTMRKRNNEKITLDENGFAKPANTLLNALIDLDVDLMKTLAQRARLVSRLRGGKPYPSTSQAIKDEKAVRLAWEKNAMNFSKDPRFSRDLFILLQDLHILSKEEAAEENSFVLAPSNRPLEGNIQGPGSEMLALCFAALCAGLGSSCTIKGIQSSQNLTEFLATLRNCGSTVERKETGAFLGDIHFDNNKKMTLSTKSIHIGSSVFSLYFLSFLAMSDVGITRFTGDKKIKELDLSPLRQLAPKLGARLAHQMMHTKSLPASIESSGTLAEHIQVSEELPFEALAALVTACLVWDQTTNLDLSALTQDIRQKLLHLVKSLYSFCNQKILYADGILAITGKTLSIPQEVQLYLDPLLNSYLLALTRFNGGTMQVRGSLDGSDPTNNEAEQILRWALIELNTKANSIQSTSTDIHAKLEHFQQYKKRLAAGGEADAQMHSQTNSPTAMQADEQTDSQAEIAFYTELSQNMTDNSQADALQALENSAAFNPAEQAEKGILQEERLAPLLFSLALFIQHTTKQALCLPWAMSKRDQEIAKELANKFSLHFDGLELSNSDTVLDTNYYSIPWACPDAYWGMGFALLSFVRKGIKLINPQEVSTQFPAFWNIFNSLPIPYDPAKIAVKETNDAPKRRRIIADS